MAEIIRTVKKKDILTSILHIGFNLVVAGGSLGLLLLFPDTPWAAIALVVVSKWRTFAVKPRFWVPNLLSNMTDFVLCAGLVILIWQAGLAHDLWLQLSLSVIYAVWLIFVKPMSKPAPVLIQAALSQFIGLLAVFTLTDTLPVPVVVLLTFIIGFAAARHVLMLHKENQHTLLALTWGVILAELCFVTFHWAVVYQIGSVKIPEIAVIAMILGYVVERFYNSFRVNDGVIKFNDVIWSTLFGVIFLLVVLIFFSGLFSIGGL
jgi:hypothetical protein